MDPPGTQAVGGQTVQSAGLRREILAHYCYVPRRKGYANPITIFVNIERILGYLERHAGRRRTKLEPNQCDPIDWVYDIGENGDCSVDAAVSDNVRDLVDLFGRLPERQSQLRDQVRQPGPSRLRPRGGTRVRMSLMPHDVSRRLDLRTSRVSERIAAIDDFVEAGHELHLNFSPVVIHEGWVEQWSSLLTRSTTRSASRPSSSWPARSFCSPTTAAFMR